MIPEYIYTTNSDTAIECADALDAPIYTKRDGYAIPILPNQMQIVQQIIERINIE